MSTENRPANPKSVRNPGPYEAIVVSQLDPKYMGTLQVELLKHTTSGNQAERSGQIVTVKYLSPFYGTTPLNAVQDNDNFQSTQKSYGMWFIPPDVGTTVLVMFAEGNISKGYWIGCVPPAYMNWMTPDPWAGTEYNNQDNTKKLPVGEFNKRQQTGAGNDPTKYIKPVNTDFYTILGRQGTLYDNVRGPGTSSSRREVPSSVFGISTPGPKDKRPGAPRAAVGPTEQRAQVYASRLGGSSLVFDDGDETKLRKSYAGQGRKEYADITNEETGGIPQLPADELVRLRTRTGHQILLHNSEDLIYIANAQGSAWIELTSNGKIDIYAQDSISIRSQNDLNISTDRDINMSAGRDINMNAVRNYKLTVGQNSDVKVGTDHKMDVGANEDHYVGADQKIYIGAKGDKIVAGKHSLTNQGPYDVNTAGDYRHTQTNLEILSSGYNYFTSGRETDIAAGGDIVATGTNIHLNGPAADSASEADTAAQAAVAASALWPVRVPVHEPWLGHEHLDPLTFVPSKTQASSSPSPALRETTPLINTDSDAGPVNESNAAAANSGTVTDASGNTVAAPQTVVPGEVGPIGDQPAKPVPVTDLQQYFLSELIKGVGLDPANALKTADPNRLAPGETPGNAEALGMAMAQPMAECGFKPRSENLNYSASRLRAVFPSRVKTDAFAQELAAAGPAAIGNTLYGGRYGNAQDEGYKYRGRGLIQLTFKDNYRRYGGLGGVPQVVENPDLANDPEVAVKLAVGYIKSKSISWDSYDYAALGEEFRRAVGYANQGGAETRNRIGLGRGFASKMITGDLVPLASISPEPTGQDIEAEVGNTDPEDWPLP